VSFSERRGRDDAAGLKNGSRPTVSFGLVTLLDLFENDRGAIAGLLEAALSSISRDTATIVGGVASGDRPTIIEAAHRIKGTSGSIGARRLIEISSKIEATVARSAAMADAAALDELHAALAELLTDVAAYTAHGEM